MASLNRLPIVVDPSKPQQPQQPQPPQTSTVGPRTKGQGSHQILLGGPMLRPAPPPPPPPPQKDPSALVPTLSTSTLIADTDKEEGRPAPVTPIALEPKTKRQKRQPGEGGSHRKPAPNTKESLKKVSNPLVVSQSPGLRQVMAALAKELRLSEHIIKVDNKGTKWLGKTQDDEPPLKLSQIPTDLRHNEVEFVHWQPFNGKFSLSYLLYTAKGAKYWANAPAVKWLEAAKHEGKVPGVCTFVVKNTKDDGLQYGFRYEDEAATPKDNSDDDTIIDVD